MGTRVFFFGSLVLVLGALVLHLEAMSMASKGAELVNLADRLPADRRNESLKESRTVSARARKVATCGWLAAGAGASSLIVAYRRKEAAPLFSVVALLVLYLLFQFAFV